jgi:hypothetical protein
VAGGRKQAELGAGDGRGVGPPVVRVNDPVAVAPEHERGHRDPPEPGAEPGIGHRGFAVDRQRPAVAGHHGPLPGAHRGRIDPERPGIVVAELGHLVQGQGEEVGDGMAGDLDPAGVDQDHAADSRGSGQRHLGADPPADRVAHHGDVVETEPVEQGHVEPGQAGDGVQPPGPGGAGEAGVDRGDDPRGPVLGELVGEAGHGLRPGAAVQQQEGMPGSAVAAGDRHGTDAVNGDGQGSGGSHDHSPAGGDAYSAAGTVA